jgi:hypothetical protein
MAAPRKPKVVHSDLKDVTPGKRGAAFPHDLERTPKSRKTRRRKAAGDRSGNAPTSILRPAPERRGGRDRSERKRRGRAAA